MNVALIQNGYVINVIVADPKQKLDKIAAQFSVDHAVNITGIYAGIGFTYDPETGTFIAPAQPVSSDDE